MRLARRNMQKMYYSEQGARVAKTKTLSDGRVVETGEYTTGYSEPQKMLGNIAFSSGETEAQEFGLSVSDYDCSMIVPKDAYPLTETSLIWHESEIVYLSDGTPDPNSADYKVVAVKPSLNICKYLLQRITK